MKHTNRGIIKVSYSQSTLAARVWYMYDCIWLSSPCPVCVYVRACLCMWLWECVCAHTSQLHCALHLLLIAQMVSQNLFFDVFSTCTQKLLFHRHENDRNVWKVFEFELKWSKKSIKKLSLCHFLGEILAAYRISFSCLQIYPQKFCCS